MDWDLVRERNERTKRRHGPEPNLESGRQKLFAARLLNRQHKAERDSSTAGCTWETSTRGGLRKYEGTVCCMNWQCSTQYSPLVVARLRKYYSGLGMEGRRTFLATRTTIGATVDSTRPIQGQKAYEAYLETPQVLDEKLSRHSVHEGQLCAPQAAHVQPVCKRWLTFATGDCNDTTYKWRRREELGPEMTVEHLDLTIPLPARKPKAAAENSDAGSDLVVKWLQEQAEMSCVLPSHNQIVLPWRTRAVAHAAFIKDMEERLGVSWAGQPTRIGVDKRKNASNFRYGNYLLGKVGSMQVSRRLVGRAQQKSKTR